MNKNILVILLICLTVLINFSCNRKDHSEIKRSKVIMNHYSNEWVFFQDRRQSGDAEYLMFLPLMRNDIETGEPKPVLAERWEHSEDYREWTYFLRKDVRWHDGAPVTAHDIKFSMDLRRQEGGWQPRSIEVIDDYTIKHAYKDPQGLERPTWAVYYPKHLLEELDYKDFWVWDFWTHPIGNGPYRYVRHRTNEFVELEANPDYYLGKPKIESVILKFHPTPPLMDLLSGSLDILNFARGEMLLKLQKDDRFRWYYSFEEWNWMRAIYWNHRHPLFKSPTIRRALTMAIDRHELSKVMNNPDGVPILDTITTKRQFWKGLYPKPTSYDPEGARKLLESEGWRDSDNDGIRDMNGKKFHFTLLTSYTGGYGVYIQSQFRKIGIKMEIQTMNSPATKARLKSGKFEAILWRFNNSIYHPFGHISVLGENSYIGYANPEMNQLLDLAENTKDPDKQDEIYQKIMPIFAEDMPITLFTPGVTFSIAHRRIKGLVNISRAWPARDLEHLWLEDEKEGEIK